jgi:hypothetical protein
MRRPQGFLLILLPLWLSAQGFYMPEGESGGMLNFYYGQTQKGFVHNTALSYSHEGRLTMGIAFQTATYAASQLDWNFVSLAGKYHWLKPQREGDWASDLLISYSYGDFKAPQYEYQPWDNTGSEFAGGLVVGYLLVDDMGFKVQPKLSTRYFYQVVEFQDSATGRNETDEENGYRINLTFDMLVGLDRDKSILLTPYLHFGQDIFIWGGQIGFILGKVYAS